MKGMKSSRVLTQIRDGIRWDVRKVDEKVWLSSSTLDERRPGEWIPTQEAVVEPYHGRWLLTRWSVISDYPARSKYYGTMDEALCEAKEHVDLRV